MFNDCPNEIKKMIFARVRHMDLYEVSGVSQGWWTLAMATCSPASDKYSRFLKFQVEFCNEMMPKKGGWKDWMFLEFTDDKSIALDGPPDEKMVEYLRRKEIRVRKLIYRGDPSILPNLKALFPHLQALAVTLDSRKLVGKPVELPDGIKHLRLTFHVINPKSHIKDIFKHLERVISLHIFSVERILFNGIIFDRLKKLHLDMREQSTKDIRSLVTGSKQLSIVHLAFGLIDKGWLELFPINIEEIHLDRMLLADAIVPLLGTVDAFVGRQIMKLVCQDWTKIRLFKLVNRLGDNVYLCLPQVLEEGLDITMMERETPSCLLDTGKLQVKVLMLSDVRDTKSDLDIVVPKSVQHFELRANNFGAINFASLFKDISTIEKLRIYSHENKPIRFGEMPHAVNLVSLDISLVDDATLASILRNCPSLKQLSLKWPQDKPFSHLSADLKSSSVKQLTIIEPQDSIGNILGHFTSLEDLHLEHVERKTVSIPDLAQLSSLEFVRISFVNLNRLFAFNVVVNQLDLLSFPHLVLKAYDGNETLSCIMGREKAFFRRYALWNSKNDLIEMNIQYMNDWFLYGSRLYLKGVPSSHLSHLSEITRITYDLQEFLANTSAEKVY